MVMMVVVLDLMDLTVEEGHDHGGDLIQIVLHMCKY